MTTWITTDTHFGHNNLVTKYKCRPETFSDDLYNAWKTQVKPEDTVIHLGDVSFDTNWLLRVAELPGKKILVRGNHDTKTGSWYLEHGWSFVCTSFSTRVEGIDIIFSHEPLMKHTFDINVHGHLHNMRSAITESPSYHLSLELKLGYTKMYPMSELVKDVRNVLKENKGGGEIELDD